MAAISIIVPVYNTEHYLNRCMDSILKQTFQDFEVVLIDDGSTDGSGRICDEYAKADARIRVAHKENEGVANARNQGLKAAKNEYITFVDSDDYIATDYLEVLYGLMEKYNGDLVVSHHIVEMEGKQGKPKRRVRPANASCGETVLSKAETYASMLKNEGMMTSVWGKLYHRSLFQEVRFPAGQIYEDMNVISQIVEGSHRIIGTSYAGYYYIQRADSITHKTASLEHLVLLQNEGQLLDLIQDKYPEIQGIAKRHYFRSCFYLLHMLITEPEYEQEAKALRIEIIREWRFLIFSKETSLMERGATLCLVPGISFYKIMIAIAQCFGIRR